MADVPVHNESISVLLPTTAHQHAVKQALLYWYRAAEKKVSQIRTMQAEAEDKGRKLTVAEQADVEAINTQVFHRMSNTMDIVKQIEEGGVI